MDLFLSFITVFAVTSVAMISPGPDFLCVLRHSLSHGRRHGLYAAAGIAAGLWVHIFYSIVGLAVVMAQSVIIFKVIQYVGAAYLLYLAYKCFQSRGWSQHMQTPDHMAALPPYKAFVSGFLTNALNPKATLFFLALFTQIIAPTIPLTIQVLYGVMIVTMAWVWFSVVAMGLTHARVRAYFSKFSIWIDRLAGVFFVGFALRLLTSKV